MRPMILALLIMTTANISCGESNGGGGPSSGNLRHIDSGKADVVLDGPIDAVTDVFDNPGTDLDFTTVDFEGRLENIGEGTALNPRIIFYVGDDNQPLEDSFCPLLPIDYIDPNDSRRFSVEAKHLNGPNPFATARFNSYQILWDNYNESVGQQMIPRLVGAEVRAELGEMTDNPVLDVLRVDISLRDANDCELYFYAVPVSVDVSVSIDEQIVYTDSGITMANANDIGNNWPSFNGINIPISDIGTTAAILDNSGSVSVTINTPHQGSFEATDSFIGVCFLLC